MQEKNIERLIIEQIKNYNESDNDVGVTDALVGGGAVLDSVGLVEICLYLEDLAEDNDFEFDWTSENALSKSKGMFGSVSQLASAFLEQKAAQS